MDDYEINSVNLNLMTKIIKLDIIIGQLVLVKSSRMHYVVMYVYSASLARRSKCAMSQYLESSQSLHLARYIIMQVMLSQPTPSLSVSGARHASHSCTQHNQQRSNYNQ